MSIIFLIGLIFCFGCNPPNISGTEQVAIKADGPSLYNLNKPDADIVLSSKLDEISGLAMYSDDIVGSVQDEKGNIYLLNVNTGKIEEKIDFGKEGDYEGIEFVGKKVWVLRSDGDLYRIKHLGKKKQKEKKFETFLDDDFDTEGLGYDAANNRLLIACKGYPGKGKKLKGKKAIYAFDLEEEQISQKPVFVIDLDELEDQKDFRIKQFYEKAGEFFNPGKGDLDFQPSGLAVHPQTGEIWILAHVGKKIVILDKKGKITQVIALDPSLFPQAEGITFMSDSRLIIASEGRGSHGRLLIFNPTK